jgi:DNA-binding transcriptional regulator LsrR (DeoR family)
MLIENPSFEKHYRIGELAEMWGLGRETVRRLVKDDPGVIKIRMGHKKTHTVYSIPESAARRIHTRLLNPA